MRPHPPKSRTWLSAAFLLVTTLPGSPAGHPSAVSPAGSWAGEYTSSEAGGNLAIRIEQTSGTWSIQVRATSQYVANSQYQAAMNVRVASDSISFVLTWGVPTQWTGVIRGDDAAGTIHADHWSGTWKVKRQKTPEF